MDTTLKLHNKNDLLQVQYVFDDTSNILSDDQFCEFAQIGSSEFVDLVFAQSIIEAENLYPVKTRADRRRKTAKKHHRLDKVVEDIYPVEDCNKHNLKKTIKSNKGWYIYDDNRKDNLAGQIADGMAEYEYQAKVDAFYKLVEDFLNQPVYPNLKYMLVWEEEEVVGYDANADEDYTDICQYRKFFSNLSDAELDIAEAFNEEWEPLWYKIVTEYDDVTTASLVARYSKSIPEPITHIYFSKDGERYFIDASATVYRQKVGQMPKIFLCDYPNEEPVKDEEFFFEPDECFPFDDDNESDIRKKFKNAYLDWLVHNDNDMPEFVDEKKYPFDGMSNVSKAIWDFFNEAD